jgi:hypothetical protein
MVGVTVVVEHAWELERGRECVESSLLKGKKREREKEGEERSGEGREGGGRGGGGREREREWGGERGTWHFWTRFSRSCVRFRA